MENQPENTNQNQSVTKKVPLFAMAFLYILGFFIVYKSKYETGTGLGLAMIIFGWICILISVFLSITVLIRLFKEFSKKK